MGKYSPSAILDKSPNTISTALFALVQFVVGLGIHLAGWKLGSEDVAVILSGDTVLVLWLNLFVLQPSTKTNEVATAVADKAAGEATVKAKEDIELFLIDAAPGKK